MSDLSGLMAALDRMIPPEIIDGNDVRAIAKDFVDLEIEFSPVVRYALSGDPANTYTGDIPCPVKVMKELDRYCVVEGNDFQWVGAETIKEMRARYLLLRGYYAKRLDGGGFDYSERQKVLSWYFPGGYLSLRKLTEGAKP